MERVVRLFLLMSSIISYAIFINTILFWLMRRDKWLARHHKRRIPEKTLLVLGLLGGGFGGWLAMKLYHHKTLHWYFRWCYRLNMLFWVVVILFCWIRGIQ